ncbi:hypothetical protein ARMGADRAFT_1091438 [Armillaria gallica]|uniref:Uncharacterized protein n=1 Tax=Armillaria gallica TaxID=47427 RepID=A0A2H3CHF6_ARMGA|nr:hypothetical protein ARMGADRAFT_1091438 [Armillaria gallica]
MIWFTIIIPSIPTFLLPHPSHPSLPFSHDYKSCPLVLLYLIGASPAVVRLLIDFVEQDGSGLVTGICFLFPTWPSSIPSTIHGSMVGEVDLAWIAHMSVDEQACLDDFHASHIVITRLEDSTIFHTRTSK